MKEGDDGKIDRVVAGALTGLPQRRAPSGLERRVLNEIARRASLSWWRRSFGEWPAGARVAFLALCVQLVAFSLSGAWTPSWTSEVPAWAAHTWDRVGHAPIGSLPLWATGAFGGAVNLAGRLIPPVYLYAALTLGAVLYATLFGLGAFAYRSLYLPRSNIAMSKT